MKNIKDRILDIDLNICKNIELIDEKNKGFYSQNILSQTRNLLDYIGIYLAQDEKSTDLSYNNIKTGNKFIRTQGKFRIIAQFHNFLQKVSSHYTFDENSSERLLLKYYEYLFKIREMMKSYNLNILKNLEKIILYRDKTLQEYYKKIAIKLEEPSSINYQNEYTQRYYICKIKPFFINKKVYYEITFVVADDHETKFNRIIAFTKSEILPNYAVKFSIRRSNINVIGQNMPILIIDNWEVAIRGCEISNFAKIFGCLIRNSTSSKIYKNLMALLTNYKINLLEIIKSNEESYTDILAYISEGSRSSDIPYLLDKCRDIIINNKYGCNVISYLLYTLNNQIVKLQYSPDKCPLLSNLHLSYKTKPFDTIPFNTSLVNHNPNIYDLLNCIEVKGREDEFLARHIKNNTEQEGKIYIRKKDLQTKYENIDSLISKYNSKIYAKQKSQREIRERLGYLYINEYEENTYKIIKKIAEFSNKILPDYTDSTHKWLQNNPKEVDCEEKKDFLLKMFAKSNVALIYGSAGTGKSTLINHISNRFANIPKLYLTNTNPAINNLKRKVSAKDTTFSTITKFLMKSDRSNAAQILFIDESSTVNNRDFLNILNKISPKLLILVGDIYQIESILFGNWFNIVRYFIHKESIFELTTPYRTEDNDLKSFWGNVRNLENCILEDMVRKGYTHKLDTTIFTRQDNDEIILCLNYDGLYGINNINRFLQESNKNPEIIWEGQKYKIGDPILFNNTNRFGGLLYNNLKGKIIQISKNADKISFVIEVDQNIDKTEAEFNNFKVLKYTDKNKTIIKIDVNKHKNMDDDNSAYSDNVIPFQIAYAVSIHKSQGLEYNSVKIIITEEVDEKITHNIFYTAITRARKQLKIYWSPETERNILNNFKLKDNKRDIILLSKAYPDLKEYKNLNSK